MTVIATMPVMPRHGIGGIGRSNSRGGPPCTLSASVGCRKNKRGRRSLFLKLEVDEGITVSLSKNNGAGHQSPRCRNNPTREPSHRGFDVAVTQSPMCRNHEHRNDAYLQQFASGKNGVAM